MTTKQGVTKPSEGIYRARNPADVGKQNMEILDRLFKHVKPIVAVEYSKLLDHKTQVRMIIDIGGPLEE